MLTRSAEMLARNSESVPGGMASLNRAADPVIAFSRAEGSKLWDVDGNEYIDYHAGFAPYVLGHNDPEVNAAVEGSLRRRQSNYGSGPTEVEGELARLFLKCVPSADRVQFFNTGSEATAQAVRVARSWTGREHLILIQGSYNGHHDAVAVNLMTSVENLGGRQVVGDEYPVVPITAGIPKSQLRLLHPVEFNDLEAVEVLARRHQIAALITEPVLQNIGVVKPRSGYLAGLRELADRYGFLLVFDEVKTGFRTSLGGYQGLKALAPDLSTFGKAMANGYPIAALAGRRDYMDLAISGDPSQRVLVAGTYNCHPVPVAAATATLRKLTDPKWGVFQRLEGLAARLEEGQRKLLADHGLTATVSRQGSAHCVYFMDREPLNWWDIVTSHDFHFDMRYRQELIERGVYFFPVPTKQGSISFAHGEDDINVTLTATDEVLTKLGS